jgi:hypothetical protein
MGVSRVCRSGAARAIWERKRHQTAQIGTENYGKNCGMRRDQKVSDKLPTVEQVYFIRVGKFIKIGYTTNLPKRLKSFRGATAEPIQVLAVFPGNRKAALSTQPVWRCARLGKA